MVKSLWTKNYILFLIVALGLSLGASMLNSPLPVYALRIGADNAVAGLITGLFALSSCICRPVFGNLLDRRGRQMILLLGIVGYAVVTFFYNFADTVMLLLVVRFIQGVGMSAYSTSLGTIAADLVPEEKLAEGFGYYNLIQTIAAAVGPMMGLNLIANSNFHLLFTAVFMFAVLSLIISLFIRYEKEQTVTKKASGRKKLIEKSAVPVAFAIFFIDISAGSVMTFISPYAASHGIQNIGLYFTVNAVIVFFSRILISRLLNWMGTYRAIICGMSLIGLSMIVLYVSTSINMFLIAAVLNGLGAGVIFPVLNSLVVKFCADDRRGAANATYYIGIDVGTGGGAVIGGFLSQWFGYAFLYLASAICIVVALLIYFFVIRKQMLRRKMV